MLSTVFELFTSSISVVRHFNRNASNSSVKFSVNVADLVPPALVAETVTE